MTRQWIVGAPDPEMEAIERLLLAAGEPVVYATFRGRRVTPADAYRADGTTPPLPADHLPGGIVTVECWGPVIVARETVWGDAIARCDHHRPGDPGFGRPPADFLAASSLGQVLARLGQAPTVEHTLVAAADHCLAAAYRGECPGVDPDALMRWRVSSRAAFQGRSEAEILSDIAATRVALRSSAQTVLGPLGNPACQQCCGVGSHSGLLDVPAVCDCVLLIADMRHDTPWPELPEAAAREGIGYVSGPLIDRDGRRRFTCAGSEAQVRAWMEYWAPSHGITDIYGDPMRGFAGGYER